jgi:hypothetical protein
MMSQSQSSLMPATSSLVVAFIIYQSIDIVCNMIVRSDVKYQLSRSPSQKPALAEDVSHEFVIMANV